MSKKEIGLIAAMGLTIIVSVVGQWGGTAETWLGLAFLAGILIGFWTRDLPALSGFFKWPGALRTWLLVGFINGVYFAMGYNVARQPAATHFLAEFKGGLFPYGLAGFASFLGLIISLIELPSGLSRFFRTHWPSMLFVCAVGAVLYSIIRGVLFWPEPGPPTP